MKTICNDTQKLLVVTQSSTSKANVPVQPIYWHLIRQTDLQL